MGIGSRILIVDDHPHNIEVLENILDQDYLLNTASSGEEALALAPEFRPDLVLLDVMMPGIDGYSTCRQLRTHPELNHTKIIMVSAKAMIKDRLNGYHAGADDYVIKPFDLHELKAKIRVYLRLKTLEDSDQLKSNILSLLSHETVTPINGILGALQLVQDDPQMGLEERTEFLHLAQESARKLYHLHAKSLTLEALRTGHADFNPALTELSQLVSDAVTSMTPQSLQSDTRILMTKADTAPVFVDRKQIHQVLIALLDNAIRVSPGAGQVEVCVWQDADQVCVSIGDHGPGIPPVLCAHLFEPFVQIDLCHHSEGHGLSLAIAHEIVQAHDGTIEVKSSPGQGTIFTVRLPIVNPLVSNVDSDTSAN